MAVETPPLRESDTPLEGVLRAFPAREEHRRILEYARKKGLSEDSEALLLLWTLRTNEAYLREIESIGDDITAAKAEIAELHAAFLKDFAAYTARQRIEVKTLGDTLQASLDKTARGISISLGGFAKIASDLEALKNSLYAVEKVIDDLDERKVLITFDSHTAVVKAQKEIVGDFRMTTQDFMYNGMHRLKEGITEACAQGARSAFHYYIAFIAISNIILVILILTLVAIVG